MVHKFTRLYNRNYRKYRKLGHYNTFKIKFTVYTFELITVCKELDIFIPKSM